MSISLLVFFILAIKNISNFIFSAEALIGVIAFIIFIIMLVFNNRLKKVVEEKTQDLKIALLL